MRLNILRDGKVLSGYTNVDPFGFGNEDKVVCDITNLDSIVEDAEATEIIAEDIIDFLPLSEVEGVINHWISKIRHGGEIVIGGVDMYAVCQAFTQQVITLPLVNVILHGEQDTPTNQRNLNFTMLALVDHLERGGLNIISKRMYGHNPQTPSKKDYHYYVKAVRP